MENELKLLELLGYSVLKKELNKWIIVNKDNEIVGAIRKINGSKKTLPSYEIKIDSETIFYHSTKIEKNPQNQFYDFDIKIQASLVHVKLYLSATPYIEIWNSPYGHFSFRLNADSLIIQVEKHIESLWTIESVSFLPPTQAEDKISKKFHYQKVSRQENETKFHQKIEDTWIEYMTSIKNNAKSICKIEIEQENGQIVKEDRLVYTNNDMYAIVIQKQKKAQKLFSDLQASLQKTLPFKQNIMSVLLKGAIIKQEEIKMFFQNIELQKDNNEREKDFK